jgi:glycerophosphoryl diester phosphodiesterase
VHTYTVDDQPTMEHLLDLGVDGIFTNRPDVLRGVVDERETGTKPADRGPYRPRPGCA